MNLPRQRTVNKPEPTGFLARQTQAAKRERINRIIEGIAENRPFWASEPPRIAEKFIEGNGAKSQGHLFAEGGGA